MIIPPPYQDILQVNDDVNKPWRSYFDEIYKMLNGVKKSQAPVFTGLTDTGTPAYSGYWWQVGRMIHFSFTINSSGNMTSIAGTTYINNLPLTAALDGSLTAFSQNISLGSGFVKTGTKNAYLPSFGPTSDEINILGSYYV